MAQAEIERGCEVEHSSTCHSSALLFGQPLGEVHPGRRRVHGFTGEVDAGDGAVGVHVALDLGLPVARPELGFVLVVMDAPIVVADDSSSCSP